MDKDPKPSRWRRWLLRCATGLGGVLLALLLLEGLVRVFWQPPAGGYPAGMFIADPAVGYRLTPGIGARHQTEAYDIAIDVDARGYRVTTPGAPRATGTRIVALGDSFCFGHGVEAAEAYPAMLEGLLRSSGAASAVVNTGVPGYGTHNATALLAADGAELAPDVVVLGLYLGNDFRDNDLERSGWLTARSGVLVTIDAANPAWWVTIKAAVAVHWHSAQLLLRGLGADATPTEADQVRAFCGGLDWDPGFSAAMVRQPWSPRAEAAYAASVEDLATLTALCAEHSYRLLVVLLPAPYQYHAALWNIVIARCGLDPAGFDMDKPGSRLRAWGAERGVEVLDLLPAFQRATALGEHLYIDVHFNAAGHRLAAAEIATALPAARVPAR